MRSLSVMAVLCAAGVFSGCTYSSHYARRTSVGPDRCDSPMIWDFREQAWRQDFPARESYTRTGVYPKGHSFLHDGGHWGLVSDFIEGLMHLPTFWLEAAMYESRETTYDVVFLDRNTTTDRVERLALPKRDGMKPLIKQPEFKDCLASAELAGDKGGEPVLWWKDSSGVKTLLVYQAVFNPPKGTKRFGSLAGYRLLVFRDAVFERAYDLIETSFSTGCDEFDFQTQDGRFVNIGRRNGISGGNWIFRQIDLLTGIVREIGDFSAIARGAKSDGLEIRAVERKRRGAAE